MEKLTHNTSQGHNIVRPEESDSDSASTFRDADSDSDRHETMDSRIIETNRKYKTGSFDKMVDAV